MVVLRARLAVATGHTAVVALEAGERGLARTILASARRPLRLALTDRDSCHHHLGRRRLARLRRDKGRRRLTTLEHGVSHSLPVLRRTLQQRVHLEPALEDSRRLTPLGEHAVESAARLLLSRHLGRHQRVMRRLTLGCRMNQRVPMRQHHLAQLEVLEAAAARDAHILATLQDAS
eukprot:703759-Prymnesium_polylepis.1